MPFTFSHPAIVIPVKKRFPKYLSMTGLVIGSMAPDFEYFLRFKPMGLVGHGILGFIVLNLPLCFVVAFLFHNLVKAALVANLPDLIRKRVAGKLSGRFAMDSAKSFAVFSFSSLVGMASHVFWDSFTHRGGYFVEGIPYLDSSFFVLGLEAPLYKLFQHGSTLIGAAFILYFLLKDEGTEKEVNFDMVCGPFEENRYIEGIKVSGVEKFFFFGISIAYGFLFVAARVKLFNLYGLGGIVVTFINGILTGLVFQSLKFKKTLIRKNQIYDE